MSRDSRFRINAVEFYRINNLGGWRYRLRGLDYVRCLEFPLVYKALEIKNGGRYLDVGSGDSSFPLVAASLNHVRTAVVDQAAYVRWQKQALQALLRKEKSKDLDFHVFRGDARRLPFCNASFDRITAISAIEHIDGEGDTAAMCEMSRVLAPNGKLVITVPYNHRQYRDCYVSNDTYDEKYAGKPLFYQRHYDDDALLARLVEPSNLKLVQRVTFGEPGFPFFNTFYANPSIPIGLKLMYTWLAPLFAKMFLRELKPADIRTKPDLPVVTAEGVMLVLEKQV